MIRCTNCFGTLPDENINSQTFSPCPICSSLIRADVFPAAYKPFSSSQSGESLLIDGEAGCFYHPDKQAVTACSHCGRFLCSLCDIDFNDQHLCTSCIESGKKKKKINKLEDSRIRYDNLTLGLALSPVLNIYLSILTAPATVFIFFWCWNKPSGIVRKSRLRMILALLLALGQVTGWVIFLYNLF